MKVLLEHWMYWHWIALAAITLTIEITTGTGFLLWIGISAALLGLMVFIFPSTLIGVQLIIFAGLILVSGFAWKGYLSRYPQKTDKPTLNRRSEQYIGRIFTLKTAIENGIGTAAVDDSTWRVRCEEALPAGARIQIIDVDGTFLIARSVSADMR